MPPIRRHRDSLPEAERFIPASPEEALLVFGSLGTPEFPNYQVATDTLPGSFERLEVYRLRAERREPIFNPHDRNDFTGVGMAPKTFKDPIKQILHNMEQREKCRNY
jgi:hypothetical protein